MGGDGDLNRGLAGGRSQRHALAQGLWLAANFFHRGCPISSRPHRRRAWRRDLTVAANAIRPLGGREQRVERGLHPFEGVRQLRIQGGFMDNTTHPLRPAQTRSDLESGSATRFAFLAQPQPRLPIARELLLFAARGELTLRLEIDPPEHAFTDDCEDSENDG
jgi:hypothetical protein